MNFLQSKSKLPRCVCCAVASLAVFVSSARPASSSAVVSFQGTNASDVIEGEDYFSSLSAIFVNSSDNILVGLVGVGGFAGGLVSPFSQAGVVPRSLLSQAGQGGGLWWYL